MKDLFVPSLPLKDVIENLAKEMGTTFSEDCDEYLVKIPENFGSGIIKGINFDNGTGLINYDCEFKEDVNIHFTSNNIHPLKFIYCSEGHIQHKFPETEGEKTYKITQFQNIIAASSSNNGHVLKFPKKVKVFLSSLEINRKEFNYKLDCNIQKLDEKTQAIFSDIYAKELFFYSGNYSITMGECIDQMRNFNSKEFVNRLYLEGKAMEILSIQIQDLMENADNEEPKSNIRKVDLDKIQMAVKILKEELANPLTVKDLAKKVGTNATKLQAGFQQQFKTSVNNYLKNLRLQYAKEQIIVGEMNISEITAKIGIINKSYFSRLFKEAYGVNPKELSLQLKNK